MASEKQITDLLQRLAYKYKDLAKRDILSTLGYFKELNVQQDKYVYPNGTMKDLIALNGTIPVNYKSSRYNIPVQLFLSDTHPYTPPLCYVRPTSEMSVNISESVDSNGRINLPCLREWNYPQSDMYVLLNLMTMKFSEHPPVFAKRQGQPSGQPGYSNQSPTTNSSYPPFSQNRPVYPGSTSSSSGAGYNSTPYPQSNNSTPYPSSNSTPYPSAYPSNNNLPYQNNPYYPMPQAASSQPTSQPSQPLSYMKSGSGTNIGNVRPTSVDYQQTTPYPPIPTERSFSEDTIKPEHYKMSLISAVQDRARERFFELTSLKQAEIDSLNRVRKDLVDGQNHLESFINEADYEILNLKNLKIELDSKRTNLKESINQMQHRDSADIEDAVVAPAPLYRQLMQLFAEELAIQDFIFYMSEGLQNRTVNLESFLKQTRFLSRKQFMLRATMQKAREKALLPI